MLFPILAGLNPRKGDGGLGCGMLRRGETEGDDEDDGVGVSNSSSS